MVHLGVRPRGITPGYHVNGRETFLVGIDWVDGWPVVREDRYDVPPVDHSFIDTFDVPELDQRWLGVGMFPRSFVQHEDGEVVLKAESGAPGIPLLATRVRDAEWTASARIDASEGTGALVLRIDADHECRLTFDGRRVDASLTVGPAARAFGSLDILPGEVPTLRLGVALPPPDPYWVPDEVDLIELSVQVDDGAPQTLGTFDGRYLSTEVAGRFSGRVVGVEATSGSIVLQEFQYATEAGSVPPEAVHEREHTA